MKVIDYLGLGREIGSYVLVTVDEDEDPLLDDV